MESLIGMVCGKRVIIQDLGMRSGKGDSSRRWVVVKCQCGNIQEITFRQARSSEQCKNCRNRYLAKTCNTSHGLTNSKVYYAWQHMKNRTTNPKAANYSYYGGRGIKVCQRWLDSFEAFYEDMGQPPSDEHTLERIDVNGDYCKENCKWATKKEQTRNRRSTSIFFGKPVAEWAEELDIPYHSVSSRLKAGKTIDDIKREWDNRPKPIFLDGIRLPEWCKLNSVDYAYARLYVRRGLSSQEILYKYAHRHDKSKTKI